LASVVGLAGCTTRGGEPPEDAGADAPFVIEVDASYDAGTDARPMCAPGEIDCGGRCTRVAGDPLNCGSCGNVCPPGVGCAVGRCDCFEPMIACDGICLDPSTNSTHCGACNNTCAEGEMCRSGRCIVQCDPPNRICVNRAPDDTLVTVCADLTSDPANCGSCNTRCSGGAVCIDSRCQCPTGQTNCGGRCVDLQTDPLNCGACRNSCGADGTCTAGRCTACGTGLTDCGGRCVDTASDRLHCGACGRSCGPMETCAMGRCSCSAGLMDCGMGCIDPMTDVRNCGACGNDCGPGGVCTAGACTCSGLLTLCGGACRDLMTDRMNCGECGRVCTVAGSICSSGTCACPTGMTDCSGTCRNLSSDPGHCGECGRACPMDIVCVRGECTDVPPPPNDTCSGAIALTGASGTRTADTLVGARQDSGGDCGGAEVYYSITVTERSLLYLDTFGTSFDTRVAYRGTTCSGAAVTCVDDACGVAQSQLAVLVEPGTHFFSVHLGPAATPDTLTLRWQVLGAAGGMNRQITTSGMYSGTTAGTGIRMAPCTSAEGPEDGFWFTLCPGDVRMMSASTCGGATWDTVLYVLGPTGSLACNDDSCRLQSRISWTSTGPGLFELIVDGFWSFFSGAYTVNVTGL
jgi:hypothetical protein